MINPANDLFFSMAQTYGTLDNEDFRDRDVLN